MITKLGRKPTDLDYGMGEHSIDGDQLGLLDEQELTERLLQTFANPSYRPPRLPAVAMELMSLSQQPDVEFSAIESLLERDAMLTGEVLSLARSALFAGTQRVTSLRQALVRVGLNRLRDVVMQAAMNMRVFRCAAYGSCMDRLRQHAQATAHVCRIVSRYTPIGDEQAFLCGLMHDVGIAGILLVLGDVKRGAKVPDLAVLWPSIDAAHAPAGARMVELWGLPAEVALVVGAHHQVRIDGFDHPMAATVCVAEAVATELNAGFVPAEDPSTESHDLDSSGLTVHGRVDRSDAVVIQRARESLQLDESTMDLIRADAAEWLEKGAEQV